jgi:hypothetical protein
MSKGGEQGKHYQKDQETFICIKISMTALHHHTINSHDHDVLLRSWWPHANSGLLIVAISTLLLPHNEQ